jgi:hypothetical protein
MRNSCVSLSSKREKQSISSTTSSTYSTRTNSLPCHRYIFDRKDGDRDRESFGRKDRDRDFNVNSNVDFNVDSNIDSNVDSNTDSFTDSNVDSNLHRSWYRSFWSFFWLWLLQSTKGGVVLHTMSKRLKKKLKAVEAT